MRKSATAVAALLTLAISLAGCDARPEPEGLWSNAIERITFYEDGVAIIESQNGPVTLTWRALADDRFLLSATGAHIGSLYGCVAGDVLNLRNPKTGGLIVYHRGPWREVRQSDRSVLDAEHSGCEP